ASKCGDVDEHALDRTGFDVERERCRRLRQYHVDVVPRDPLQDWLEIPEDLVQLDELGCARLLVSVGRELPNEPCRSCDFIEESLTLVARTIVHRGQPLLAFLL